MIFYLFLPAVVFCVAGSEPANITDELNSHTLSAFTYGNSTTKPNNKVPSSNRNELKEMEDELERNNASLLIAEDNEHFQDQEIQLQQKHCDRDLLIELSHSFCGEPFQTEMHKIPGDDHCVMTRIIRPYNDLTICLEIVTSFTNCYFPNPDIQDVFLNIHSTYFHNCSKKAEELLEDAPTSLVVALTIIPVSLIPVMVCLVLWKS